MCSREDINNMINVDIELILFTNTDIKMLMNKISVAERDPNDIRCWRSTYQKETKLHYLSSRENQIKKKYRVFAFLAIFIENSIENNKISIKQNHFFQKFIINFKGIIAKMGADVFNHKYLG